MGVALAADLARVTANRASAAPGAAELAFDLASVNARLRGRA
jgi:hypothetical protein